MSQPTVFNGRYELHRRIARGGMADVFLARDQLLDRPVAVKVLFPEFAADPAFVTRFRREAQAAANLNHPNIVNVYDWGQIAAAGPGAAGAEPQSTYFIVMEYVEGRSLADIVRAEGPLHPDRAADVAIDIAAALGFAHRNGVIHRDVKPGNVLVSPSGQVKVADFGIARAMDGADENLTQAGAVMGTATYFSPEQAQGLPLDPRSDLYSLGAVLYEMVTGRPPFTGESPVAVAYKHVQEQAAPPSRVNTNVPPGLDAVVLRLLAKSPTDRYPSAEDLRADLRRYRQGEPVLAAGAFGAAAVGTAAGAAIDATQAVPAAGPGATQVVPAYERTETVARGDYYRDDPDYREPRRTGLFVVVLVLLLGALAVLLFFLAQALTDDEDPTAELVDVPNVVNETQGNAETILRNNGFTVRVTPEKNDAVEAGLVFDQDPDAGVRAERGSAVEIKVSQGANTVPMPEVIGSTFDEARTLLTSQGFTNISAQEEPDDEAPANEVIAQQPTPGTEVAKDTPIVLTVSSGPPVVAIPDVAGLSPTEASNVLGQAGFDTAVTEQASDTVEDGTVIGTNPPAGTELPQGSEVTIIVSSGPDLVTVPDVVGDSQEDATDTLEAAGFDVVVEETIVAPPGTQDGEVVDQDPEGDSQAPEGSTVTITVFNEP
jgi:eukaryotic-like serine/threonine-protein kinase